MLRLGYCLPFLSTPPLPLFPSQCLLPAPSLSRGLLWRRSPWASLPWVLWSLLHSLLQPSVHSVEDLEVMASGHRPLPSPSLCGRVSLPDGDHSVYAPVCTSGGLDGLHRSRGSVSSSASSSYFSSLSSLHNPRHGLPVPSAVLWPLHGSTGLHQGHGSCFSYPPFSGEPYATVPRRLAGPVFLSGVSPRGSSDCPPTLSRVGNCRHPPEVQPRPIAVGSISGGCHSLHLFQGFSVGGTHLTAVVNSR